MPTNSVIKHKGLFPWQVTRINTAGECSSCADASDLPREDGMKAASVMTMQGWGGEVPEIKQLIGQ